MSLDRSQDLARAMVPGTATGRRGLLAMAALAPFALLSAARAAAACYDPAALPLSQKSRRRSLGYTDVSADPAKRCGLCAYFTAGDGGCGTCQLLSGGPVSAASGCTSFAARAA